MTAAGGRTKVAVLGGGMGAMTTAFELTQPHLRGRYDVTVYQPGWRLGGKCASGRGPDSRIEEHGLHVWFGFYANAFDMIQRCYEEWSPPESYPIRTWDAAFEKCNDIVLFESWRDRWTPWHLHLDPNDEIPGADHDVSPRDFFEGLFDWPAVRVPAAAPRDRAQWRRDRHPRTRRRRRPGGDANRPRSSPRARLGLAAAAPAGPSDRRIRGRGGARGLGGPAPGTARRVVAGPAQAPRVHGRCSAAGLDHDQVRRFAIMLDLGITTIAGLIADDVLTDGFGDLNREDLWAWLRRHGAEQVTLEHAAVIKALYDLVFAYREGDKRRPDLAAGKALQAMIRIGFEYKGAILWKMQAGMGDTVFTPLYDVLRRRGVRFRFFNQVTNLGVSEDGRSVATIEAAAAGATAQPAAMTRSCSSTGCAAGRASRCGSRSQDGEQLSREGINFENVATRSGWSRSRSGPARTSTRSCSGSRSAVYRRSAASWRRPTGASSGCSTTPTRS